MIREHGVEALGDVRLAVLETAGSISIVPIGACVVRTAKHIRQTRKR